jgi:hypothetical protein
MTVRKAATRSSGPRQNHGDKLKDEVYRQMFRLEANRPDADLDLAIALLRGWLASYSEPEALNMHEWLKKVCPICLRMIEARQPVRDVGQQCVQ